MSAVTSRQRRIITMQSIRDEKLATWLEQQASKLRAERNCELWPAAECYEQRAEQLRARLAAETGTSA